MRTRLLTVVQLEQAGACTKGITVFRELFGDCVEVSVELAEKYHKELYRFVEWGVEHLLSEKGYAEYLKIRDVALEGYQKILVKAFAEIYVEGN